MQEVLDHVLLQLFLSVRSPLPSNESRSGPGPAPLRPAASPPGTPEAERHSSKIKWPGVTLMARRFAPPGYLGRGEP
jgi:hypothetical protein